MLHHIGTPVPRAKARMLVLVKERGIMRTVRRYAFLLVERRSNINVSTMIRMNEKQIQERAPL
jgi:hypothetical protein